MSTVLKFALKISRFGGAIARNQLTLKEEHFSFPEIQNFRYYACYFIKN